MVNFYAQVAKMLAKESPEESMSTIESTPPELSAKGSQDDMSIACVYNDGQLADVVKLIVHWQQGSIQKSIEALNGRLEQLLERYNQFEGASNLSKSEQIDLTYTVKELKRTYQNKREQAKKFDKFSTELGEDIEPYNDEYGFGEQFVLIAEKRLSEQVADDVEPTAEQNKPSTKDAPQDLVDETALMEKPAEVDTETQTIEKTKTAIEDNPGEVVATDKDSDVPIDVDTQIDAQSETQIDNSDTKDEQ